MANVLKVPMQHAIVTLLERGRSQRSIARELGLARETVAGHARRWRERGGGNSNQAIPTAGSGGCRIAGAWLREW
jgi:DNA-binding NarL/FixJ family response regulator